MAWNELLGKRGRSKKVFQDSVDPKKFSYDTQPGSCWHYDSAPDAGDLAQEVDFNPQRVLAAGHDGWRVTQSGWHYFLGKPNGLADGFVGFGGRHGDRWLLFRLARVGYLHWPTRSWDDIGGAPTYNRANLSQSVREQRIPTTEEMLPVENTATWSDLWTTPGGGALDISWKANGNRLKEEIKINQAARTWIAANRPPATPAGETYFSFVFRLGSALDIDTIQMDLSYLAKWIKNQVEQNPEGDFDDDDGTQPIEVRNALDEFLFLLPASKAFVRTPESLEVSGSHINLRKRIYKDGTDYYLLIGAKVSDLVGMPAGDLIFDPTSEYQPTESTAKDTSLNSGNPTTNYGTDALISCGVEGASDIRHGLIEWDISDIDAGSSCDVAWFQMHLWFADMNSRAHSAYELLSGRSGWTEAGATWNTYDGSNSWGTAGCGNTSSDRSATPIAQFNSPAGDNSLGPEAALTLADIEDWFGNTNENYGILVRTDDDGTGFSKQDWLSSSYSPEPLLHIEYSAGGGGPETASVSPVTVPISLPAVTATYIGALSASVAPVSTTLALPSVTATYVGVYSASVSPVAVPISLPAVTATEVVELGASVNPVTVTIVLPAVTATYTSELSASVSPVTVPISLPTVTATSGNIASVSSVTVTIVLPGVTAAYVSELSASLSPVAVLIVLPSVTAVSVGGQGPGPDPVWKRHRRDEFRPLPHIPQPRISSTEEQMRRFNEKQAEQERIEAEAAERATLKEMAVKRVEDRIERIKLEERRAEARKKQSMINLEMGKIQQERRDQRTEEQNKIRRKNLQKARRKKKRMQKKK